MHESSTMTEFDSHANMVVVGTNSTIFDDTGEMCTVNAFSKIGGKLGNVPIVDILIAYNCPYQCKTYLTLVRNVLHIPELDVNLIPPFMKYENAGEELIGRALIGIPPNSCEFGILPLYISCFQTVESLVEEFACLVFPIQHSKLLAIFIYHENWTFQATSQTYQLRCSLYFSFTDKRPNRLSFVKTSLPWENDHDYPVLTVMLIHYSPVKRLMEIHTLQKTSKKKI